MLTVVVSTWKSGSCWVFAMFFFLLILSRSCIKRHPKNLVRQLEAGLSLRGVLCSKACCVNDHSPFYFNLCHIGMRHNASWMRGYAHLDLESVRLGLSGIMNLC